MALRVLTSEEKESLKTDPEFLAKCEWALREYAAYWSIHDGNLPSEAARIKWAKDRKMSVEIHTGEISDPNLTLQFLKVGKGIQIDLGPSPQPNNIIISALLSGSKFEEMSSLYMDLKGQSINFSITGN
jgi:hypothetical protein